MFQAWTTEQDPVSDIKKENESEAVAEVLGSFLAWRNGTDLSHRHSGSGPKLILD